MPVTNRSFLSAVSIFVVAIAPGIAFAQNEAKPQPATPEQVQFFEAKIRPVLADNCLKCHGPEKQKSGLRLDSFKAAIAGGDFGPAVVPGNAEESLLVQAVLYGDDAPKMPPSGKLEKTAIDDLSRWVAMGAPWPGGDEAAEEVAPAKTAHSSKIRKPGDPITDEDRAHWAYQPIARPARPEVSDSTWTANPIDAFILSGLDAAGLSRNPPATPVDLIRRATYDLTGLPPTLDETAEFVRDPSLEAYEALIDRLLASPHYGEKWGRHWLDLVRYAETNSYERDNPKPHAWRYRDYVIRSLNADKPYDRFLREQLAGDEIEDGGPDALIATGYYRLGIWDDEPTDRLQARYDGLDDIVATTGQVFLGMTIDCARCHDHKIDPIPQKDYYRFVSFFQNINTYRNGGSTDEAAIFPSAEAEQAFLDRSVALKAERDEVQEEIDAIQGEFLAKYEPDRHDGLNGSVRVPDMEGLRYRFYRDTWETLPEFDILKPEDVGTLEVPLFDLGERTRDEAFGFVFEGVLIIPVDGEYTFTLDADDGARLSVEGKPVINHDGTHTLGNEVTAVRKLKAGRTPVRLDYFQRSDKLGLKVAWSGPGFPRRSLSSSNDDAKKVNIQALIRSDGERVLGKPAMRKLRGLFRELKAKTEAMLPPERALSVSESGSKAPETHVLLRGNPHVEGDAVEPAFLSVLGGAVPPLVAMPEGSKTCGRRTALADWIAARDNPLTARVLANRLWQYHFGRGIVRSSSNFGTQGDKPTHPRILDELASDLLENGWRLKPVHKKIMTSNAYKMASTPNAENEAKDPANDHFWRFDMRRLTAEEIRDSILAVGGNLNLKMFGPSIYPEIPDEVKAGQSVPGSGWHESTSEEASRRSIYIHIKRSLIVPILESFDVAETDRSSPVRFSTTQPTQALAMVNGKFLNDEAALFADRLKREADPNPEARVRLAFRLVSSRDPGDDEMRRGLDLIETLKTSDGLSDDAALRDFCLVMLNLNEFLYLD